MANAKNAFGALQCRGSNYKLSLKKIFEDSELNENSVIRNFLITASDGKSYETF
jgi:hypothetical protein